MITISCVPFSPTNLLKELNQRGEFNWALELKNGKEAYAYLMQVIGTAELNVTQTRNGLHALFYNPWSWVEPRGSSKVCRAFSESEPADSVGIGTACYWISDNFRKVRRGPSTTFG